MIKHPAVYSDKFIPIFAKLLEGYEDVLDPFAGTGKLALIKEYGFKGKVLCNEMEDDYSFSCDYDVDRWIFCDAEKLPIKNSFISAICTSPTYGNRMADHHNAKDKSKRITYTHLLGKPLKDGNTGKMQFGTDYKNKHMLIYKEFFRILKDDGLCIINISNHIRKGEVVDVVSFHKNALVEEGFKFINEVKVKTKRMKFGANSNLRTDYESILIFKK